MTIARHALVIAVAATAVLVSFSTASAQNYNVGVATANSVEQAELEASIQALGHTVVNSFTPSSVDIVISTVGASTGVISTADIQAGAKYLKVSDHSFDWTPNSWLGLGTSNSITVAPDQAHPITAGLPSSWTSNGFWEYGISNDYIGWSTDTSLTSIMQCTSHPNTRLLVVDDAIGSGRAAYVGWNIYGSAAHANDLTILERLIIYLVTGSLNSAPVVAAPSSAVAGTEDMNATLSGANAISITDTDLGPNDMQVTISADNGATVSLASMAGITVTNGTGMNDTTITFQGLLASVNAAMDGLVVSPAADFVGTVTLDIEADDLGNGGATAPATGDAMPTIDFAAVNDAPTIVTVTTAVKGVIGEAVTLTGADVPVIDDVDAATNPISVSLACDHGIITLGSTANLTFTAGANGQQSMTFTGSLPNVALALTGMSITGDANYRGSATVTIGADDLGNVGSGGAMTATGALPLEFLPAQEIELAYDGTLLAKPGGEIEISASAANGTSFLNGETAYAIIRVHNRGLRDLTLSGQPTFAGEISGRGQLADDIALTIGAESFLDVPVLIVPLTNGIFTTVVAFESNDPANPAVTVTIRGQASGFPVAASDCTMATDGVPSSSWILSLLGLVTLVGLLGVARRIR